MLMRPFSSFMILLLSLGISALAQDEISVHFPGGANHITIAAEFQDGAPYMEVRVDGSARSLCFTIDSGSSYTMLDKGVATELGLKPDGKGSVRGAGAGTVEVAFLKSVGFTIAGLKTGGYNVRIVDLSGVRTDRKHAIDGFFGFDFLDKLVVTLDPDKGTVTLTDPQQFQHTGQGVVLPITFFGTNHRWIYVPGTVKVEGMAPKELSFFVDSGSTDAVNTPLIKQSTEELKKTRTGVGLGSPGNGVLGRVEWFRLGPFEILNAPSVCCSTLEGTENSFGDAILSRFVATFDYSRRQLILEKGQHFGDAFANLKP